MQWMVPTFFMKSSHVVTLGSLCFLAWLTASFLTQHPIETRGVDQAVLRAPRVIPATQLVPAQKVDATTMVAEDETGKKSKP